MTLEASIVLQQVASGVGDVPGVQGECSRSSSWDRGELQANSVREVPAAERGNRFFYVPIGTKCPAGVETPAQAKFQNLPA